MLSNFLFDLILGGNGKFFAGYNIFRNNVNRLQIYYMRKAVPLFIHTYIIFQYRLVFKIPCGFHIVTAYYAINLLHSLVHLFSLMLLNFLFDLILGQNCTFFAGYYNLRKQCKRVANLLYKKSSSFIYLSLKSPLDSI